MLTDSLVKSMAMLLFVLFSANLELPFLNPRPIQPTKNKFEKETYIPAKIWRIPDNNDYSNNESEYSHKRKAESNNILIFWAKEFGDDPGKNKDTSRRFDVTEALKECERYYNFYVDSLKIVQKGNSITDRYKVLFYVIGGEEQTAFGGGEENKVGILWTPAIRIRKAPYGALAHELGHAFQYLASADNGTGLHGPIMEMSAQYMLWQVYPEWMTFENYHLTSFMKKTHYAFLHPTNMYHSPYVIEYWSDKHGKDFFGKLLREVKKGEDPVMAYKRVTGITQSQFNDEIFDAACRFITWDLKRIERLASKYANQHQSQFNPVGNGWYQIAESNYPQSYGYNGVRLNVPLVSTNIKLAFKGLLGKQASGTIKKESGGWHYGFLAVKKDGNRVYGKMHSDPVGNVDFEVPAETAHLWLVVSGAPKQHSQVSDKDENNMQWPYKIKLSGTSLDTLAIH